MTTRERIELWLQGYGVDLATVKEILDTKRVEWELKLKDPKGVMDAIHRELGGFKYANNESVKEAYDALNEPREKLFFLSMVEMG